MKKCPFCAEEIQYEAIVCRFCGRELAPQKVAQVSETLTSAEGISEEPKPESAVKEKLAEQDIPAPDEVDKPQRPIWKSALRVGYIIAIMYAIYLLSQFLQGRTSVDRVGLEIIFGGLAAFVVGTLLGFVIIPLWHWKKWAPFALASLVIAGVLGYAGGIIDLQLPSFINPLPTLSQPTSTIRMPTLEPTPWMGTLLGKYINVDVILEHGGTWHMKDHGMEFSAGRHVGNIVYRVTFEEVVDARTGDATKLNEASQFFCEVALLHGLDCTLGISHFKNALDNGYSYNDIHDIEFRSEIKGYCPQLKSPIPLECISHPDSYEGNYYEECCETDEHIYTTVSAEFP